MMTLSRFAFSALAALSVATPALAQDCITPEEGRAVVTYLMPDLLLRAEATCRPLIGGQSYLSGEADVLAARLTPLSQAQWPVAKRALETHMDVVLPENELLLSLGRQALAEGIVQELDSESCLLADRVLEQLDPLPPENLVEIAYLAIETGVKGDPDSDVRVCPRS